VRAPEADGGAAIIKREPRRLDLSAIAKGLGVDQIYTLLDDQGYANFLVEIGGEVRVKGDKDGLGWKIAVEKPIRGERAVEQVLSLKNVALATSGDYRNYREIDGVAYSHTIDPSTGRPVTHQLASVTVADSECAMADGWATTLLVLGPDKGYELAVSRKIPAMFIERFGDTFIVKQTPRFERLLAGEVE
jgi:thiamine biosynthesis lipoprotein